MLKVQSFCRAFQGGHVEPCNNFSQAVSTLLICNFKIAHNSGGEIAGVIATNTLPAHPAPFHRTPLGLCILSGFTLFSFSCSKFATLTSSTGFKTTVQHGWYTIKKSVAYKKFNQTPQQNKQCTTTQYNSSVNKSLGNQHSHVHKSNICDQLVPNNLSIYADKPSANKGPQFVPLLGIPLPTLRKPSKRA